MCGRFNFTDEQEEDIKKIILEVTRRFGENAVRTGEVSPSHIAAVLERGSSGPEASALKWGFPKWDGKGVIFNARSETALEKPTFKAPLLSRRCVVPSTGFYEWEHIGTLKRKYHLKLPGEGVLYMAGIAKDDVFTILTTEASSSMARIHNRMPVILYRDELRRWLEEEGFMREVLQRPGPELLMELSA